MLKLGATHSESSEQVDKDDEDSEDSDPDSNVDAAVLVPILQSKGRSGQL